ncbi:MAG: DinB family protein [Actinomycetota bacterium]
MDIGDRPDPAPVGSELELLTQFLDFHRATALWKCDGVSDADLMRTTVPSGTTMLGLVKHLAWVERYWFREVFRDEQAIPFPYSEADPDAELRIEPGETGTAIFALYREACRESDEAIAGASCDEAAAGGGKPVLLRWILIHMIEETARHNGHLDILREQIDGATGE